MLPWTRFSQLSQSIDESAAGCTRSALLLVDARRGEAFSLDGVSDRSTGLDGKDSAASGLDEHSASQISSSQTMTAAYNAERL